jgi:hypothetical protein
MFMETPRSNRTVIKFVRNLKASTACVDCNNYFHYAVMQFDHVNGQKSDKINNLVRRASLARVIEELELCDIVCANCHAIRTYKRQHGLM